ncbi:hypothetical protein WR25_00210 isoform A [Diploscapter pachys]|nr:hypothetical protein WR25_00210 isoform A [Diploscapter pachys]
MSPANFTVRMNATSTLPTSSYMMIVPETSGTTPENVSGNNFLENVPEQKNNSSLSTFLILMLSICVSGILLNLIVLCRRKRRRCSSAMRTSLFLLSTMALADTLCLIALLLFLTMRFITAANNPIFLNFFCKINTFVIHSTSAFSIWCWLVLSSVRYMAIYRPYSHLKINRQPRYAVIALSIFCCVIELWVLWDSDYIEEAKMCGNAITSGATAEMLHLFQIGEIILSYFLPAAVIIAMDLKVLLGRSIWMAVRADEKNGNALEVDSSDSRLSEKRPTRNVQDSTDRPGEDYSEMKEAIYESGRVISGPSKLFDNGQIKLKRNR